MVLSDLLINHIQVVVKSNIMKNNNDHFKYADNNCYFSF